jgi:tetratricopeptide (TPR) repeat protein
VSLNGVEPRVAEAIRKGIDQVKQEPRSAKAWGHLGRVFLAHGLTDQAVVCLAQAERLGPKDPRWPYLQGFALAGQGPEGAIPHLRRAVERTDPESQEYVTARLYLAELLLATGADDQAGEQLAVVAGKGPNNERLRFNQGLLACRQEKWREARHLLVPLCDHSVVRVRVCAQLALVCRRLKLADEAADYARRSRAPDSEEGWEDPYLDGLEAVSVGRQRRLMELGAQQKAKRFEEADAILKDLLADGDADGALKLTLANHLNRTGRYTEAEQALLQALETGAQRFRLWYALSTVQFAHAEGLAKQGAPTERARARFAEATTSARKALEVKPDSGWALLHLGRCLLFLGRAKEAIPHLREAVVRRPEQGGTHLALGEALIQDGQLAEARESLDRAALVVGKDDPEVVRAFAALRRKEKDKGASPKVRP